jgi:hypothetical protein
VGESNRDNMKLCSGSSGLVSAIDSALRWNAAQHWY